MTSLDITSVYGNTVVPALSKIPWHTMNFAEYGIKYLSAGDLALEYHKMENAGLKGTINYLMEKIGYDHTIPKMYARGIETVASWGLISKKYKHADTFFCENEHNGSIAELQACLNGLSLL